MGRKRNDSLSEASSVAVAGGEVLDLSTEQPSREPIIGEDVWYFRHSEGGARQPVPAKIFSRPLTGEGWNILVFQMAASAASPRHNVLFSEEPKAGCWTWPR